MLLANAEDDERHEAFWMEFWESMPDKEKWEYA